MGGIFDRAMWTDGSRFENFLADSDAPAIATRHICYGGGKGGGGGGGTTTQTSTVQIPPEVLANYNTAWNAANQAAQAPFTPYPGEMVAGVNPVQNTGIGLQLGQIGQTQPYFDAAGNALTGGVSAALPYYDQAGNLIANAANTNAGYIDAATAALYGGQQGAQPYTAAANANLGMGAQQGQTMAQSALQALYGGASVANPINASALGNVYGGQAQSQGYLNNAGQIAGQLANGVQGNSYASLGQAGSNLNFSGIGQSTQGSVIPAGLGGGSGSQMDLGALAQLMQPNVNLSGLAQGPQINVPQIGGGTNAPNANTINSSLNNLQIPTLPPVSLGNNGTPPGTIPAVPNQQTTNAGQSYGQSGGFGGGAPAGVPNTNTGGGNSGGFSGSAPGSFDPTAFLASNQIAGPTSPAPASNRAQVDASLQQGITAAGVPQAQAQAQIAGALSAASPYNQQASQLLNSGLASASPYNQAAQQGITGALAGAQPYQQQATQLAQGVAQAVNPEEFSQAALQQYMSPYNDSVVQATMRQLQQQQGMEQQQLIGNLIQKGAFGGDRGNIDRAVLANQHDMATGSILSNLYNQNYGQALGAFQQQQGVKLGAAEANRAALGQSSGLLGALGQQGYAQQMGAAQAQAGLGQQIYGQQTGTGQALGQLGQNIFGQQLGAGQANAAMGAQLFGQGATTAQTQMAAQNAEAGQWAQQQQIAQQGQIAQGQLGLGAYGLQQQGQLGQGQLALGHEQVQAQSAVAAAQVAQAAVNSQVQMAGIQQQGQIAMAQMGLQQAQLQQQGQVAAGQLGLSYSQLAQQGQIAAGQLGIQAGQLSQEGQIALGQLSLGQASLQQQGVLGLGQLGLQQAGLTQQGQIAYGQLGLGQQSLAQQGQIAQGQLGLQQAGLQQQGQIAGAQLAQQQQQNLFGQGLSLAGLNANLGQQAYGQGLSTGQFETGLAGQLFGQGATTAGQVAGLGQQLYGQGANTAQLQAGLGQQVFGQGATAAGTLGSLGAQAGSQGLSSAQAMAGLGQNMYGMGSNTASQLAGMGTTQQGNQLALAQSILGGGTLQQQTQQAADQAYYNQFLQQQGYPFQTAQFLSGIATSQGALSGSTTNATTTQPGSMFSDERLKEDKEIIGRTFDGQPVYRFAYKDDPDTTRVGLMAQDVEKSHPGAVGESDGYKTVNYDEATRDAADRGHFADGGFPKPGQLEAADTALSLTPQERALYQRHLGNLYGSGGVNNPDGSRSTLYNVTADIDGRSYVLPSVYDGKILHPDAAIDRAVSQGLDQFPSYASAQEADARYQRLHDFMEKDTQAYLGRARGGGIRGHFALGGAPAFDPTSWIQRLNGGAGKGGAPGGAPAPANLQAGGHGVALPPDFGGAPSGGAGKGGTPGHGASNPFGAALLGMAQHGALPSQLAATRSGAYPAGILSPEKIQELIGGGAKDTKPPAPPPPTPKVEGPNPEAVAAPAAAPSLFGGDDPSMDAWRRSMMSMPQGFTGSTMARGGAISPELMGAGFAAGGAGGEDYIQQLLAQILSKGPPQYGGAGLMGKPIGGSGPYGVPAGGGGGPKSLTPARLPEIPRQGPSAFESGLSTVNQVVQGGKSLGDAVKWGKGELLGTAEKKDAAGKVLAPATDGLIGKGGTLDDKFNPFASSTPAAAAPAVVPTISPPPDLNLPDMSDLFSDGFGGIYARGGRAGYAAGGMPYSQIDDEYIPDDLTRQRDPAELLSEQKNMAAPLPAIQKGGGSGGGSSVLGDISNVVGIAAKVLPFFLARGGRAGYDEGGYVGLPDENDPVARLLEQLRATRPDIPDLPPPDTRPGPESRAPFEFAKDRLPGMDRYERMQEPKSGATHSTEPNVPPVFPHVPMPESGTRGPTEGALPPPQSITVPAMPPLESKTIRDAPPKADTAPPVGDGGDIFKKMLVIESGNQHFDKNGDVLTSPAGARGVAQVLPGTGPEAAKLAGLPWNPELFNRRRTGDAKLDAEALEYNRALGNAYYNKQMQDFADPFKGAAAYNAGPGAMKAALAKAQAQGGNYLDYLPAETQKYVAKLQGGNETGVPPQIGPLSPGSTPPKQYMQPAIDVPPVPGATVATAPDTPPKKDEPNWFDRNERLITSVLTGLGGAAAMGMNPRANIAGVALAGLGAGAGAYAQQGLKERELGLQEQSKTLETAKYLTDNIVKSVDPRTGQTTYFNRLSGTYMNEGQYQAYMAKALGKMAPTGTTAPAAPSAGGAGTPAEGKGPVSVTAQEQDPDFLNNRARQHMDLAQKARAEGNKEQAEALERQAKEDRDRAISITGAAKKGEAEAMLPTEIAKKGAESNIAVQQKALTDANERAKLALESIQQGRTQLSLMFDDKGNQLLNGGPAGEWLAKSAAYLKQMGFSDNAIQALTKTNPENAQELQKLSTIIGTELTKSTLGPGNRMLATEFNQFVNNATPNINMLPQAFKWIIERTVLPKAEQQMKVYESIAKLDPTKDNIADHIYQAEKANPWGPLKMSGQTEKAPQAAPEGGQAPNSDALIKQAREAIARGAPRSAVMQELKDKYGINPGGKL